MKLTKKMFVPLIMASFFSLSLTGCSSMFGDNQRVVKINSAPKGAKVTVNHVAMADKTPTETIVTDMWAPTVIKVQKPGCPTKTVTIQPEFQKIGLLNILILPGFIVDAITGDMMKIPENQRSIDMKMC